MGKEKNGSIRVQSLKETVCIILVLSLTTVKGDDPCSSFKPIQNVYERHPNYTKTVALDDHNFLPNWYGLEGFDIPSREIQSRHCGARNTIYLNESLPKAIVFQKNFKVCIADMFDSCASSFEIIIKGCTKKLRVYYLIASPNPSSAYCFENPEIKVFDPPPKFNPVTIKVDHVIEWNKEMLNRRPIHVPEVVFKCKFDKPAGNLFYKIDWYLDDTTKIQKSITQNPDDRGSDLREKDMGDRKYGINIKCGVTAYKSATGLPSNTVESLSFFAGIRAKTTKVSVERGDRHGTSFKLEFTVPFGCVYIPGDTDECVITIEMDYKKQTTECEPTVGVLGAGNHPCSKTIRGYTRTKHQKGEKWIPTVYWNITNADDGKFNYRDYNSNTFKLHLKTVTALSIYKFWNDYEIADIEVEIIEKKVSWRNARCYAHCDPHMMTFDGRDLDYFVKEHTKSDTKYTEDDFTKIINEMEKTGVFTMYRNKRTPVEVQIQVKPCAAGITNAHCICGVYIRSGRDLYVISTCGHNYFFNFVSCEDGSLTVGYKETKKYEIYLPTGAKVTVEMIYKWELNVDIDSAPLDERNVEGLCGDLDGNKHNDFVVNGKDMSQTTQCGNGNPQFQCRNDFILYYKVPDDKILFPVTDKNKKYVSQLPRWNINTDRYCVCKYDDGNDHTGIYAESECSYKRHQLCKHPKLLKCDQLTKPLRKRRDIASRLDHLQKHLKSVRKVFKRSAAEMSKKKQKRETFTEEDARRYCESKMQTSTAVQACNQSIPAVSTHTDMENCIFDVSITGVKDWSNSAMASVKHVCLHQASSNGTLKRMKQSNESVGMNVSTSGGFGLDLASFIESVVCPNDCSGNGDCVNGICVCEKYFGASDCSFDLTQPPIIHSSLGDDYCDAAEDHCDDISIHGENFIMSPNLTCKVAVKEIDINGKTSKTRYPLYTKGDGYSPFQVYCPLDVSKHKRSASTDSSTHFLTSYEISIANDGTLFGTSKHIIRYDSTCQVKTNSPNIFNLKSGYCFINGECINHGQHNTLNTNEKCDVYNKKFFWTDVSKPSIGLSDNVVIGIAVGSAVALAAIVALIMAIILIKKKHDRKFSTPVEKFSTVNSDKVRKYGRPKSPK